MRALSQRRPILIFYLLALGLATLVMVWAVARFIADPASIALLGEMVAAIYGGGDYINIATILPHALAKPDLLGIFIFAAAPSIAALVVAARGGGGGLPVLLGRLRLVGEGTTRRRAALVYTGILCVYAAGFAAYDFVAGPGVVVTDRVTALGGSLLLGATLGLLLDEGGTLEELGWRGFAWPLLQAALASPLRAALLLGVLHWAWHLPREILTVLSGADPAAFLAGQGVFLALCVALAVLTGYCVNLAGGSVWPAIFVHGGSNVWSKALSDHVAPSFGLIDLRSLILCLLALAVALVAGRRLGRMTPAEASRAPP